MASSEPASGTQTDRSTAAATSKPARVPRRLRRVYALEDLEPAARRHLPPPVFGYIAGAAETCASFNDNRVVFDEIAFLPRALVDVSARTLDVDLMGTRHALPFGIAPMGVSALSGYRGDISLARAACSAGIPMMLSGSSLISLEEVVDAAPGSWFQAYLPGQLPEIDALVDRAARAGIDTLVVTVDTAVVPSRENNLRTGFKTPMSPDLRLLWEGLTHPGWAFGTFLKTFLRYGPPHFENNAAQRGAALLSRQAVRDFSGREFLNWEVMAHVRRRWTGRMVLKGILHPEDVVRARTEGMDGVILSNHGGRQLDGAISPMRVLPRAREAARDMALMIDSGFRRGTDILKAFAIGADFCFIGRPFNYAAALGGEAGVDYAIGLMRTQLRADLGMLGLNSMTEMNRSHLYLDRFRCLGPDPAPVPTGD